MPAVAAPPSHREGGYDKKQNCDGAVDEAETRELGGEIVAEVGKDVVAVKIAGHGRSYGCQDKNNEPMVPSGEAHRVDGIIKEKREAPRYCQCHYCHYYVKALVIHLIGKLVAVIAHFKYLCREDEEQQRQHDADNQQYCIFHLSNFISISKYSGLSSALRA